MKYRIYKESDFTQSRWTGGTTEELAIFPENSRYLDRNFIWRLSSATCEQEETVFSKLPDYDRVLMVLEGSAVLAHQDVRVSRLDPLSQDRFDGGYTTKIFGKIKDYNLMVAKGNQGFLDVLTPTEESQKLMEEPHGEDLLHTTALYCKDGYAAVTIGGRTEMLTEGQQFVADFEAGEPAEISVMGEGILIRAQIFYQYEQGQRGPTVIPAEKATFDDFKTCVYLVNSRFRGAGLIFRKLKKQWIDEELSGAIEKVERIYLPFFVTVFGACLLAVLAYGRLQSAAGWMLLIGGWVLLNVFVISPAMYFAVVPKPTRKHIKDIDQLTPYEQQVREMQLASNPRLEKLLKKYKNSGRQCFDEDGNAYFKD